MLPTFVIGLREGLEAALIVGIIAAFLNRQGQGDLLRWVFAGISSAIGLCVVVGVALDRFAGGLPQRQQEGLETVIAALAVTMVSYMVIWMRRNSRQLKGQLEALTAGALDSRSGAARALVAMAFLAVLREGLETVVFLLAAFQESGSGNGAGLGAFLGIGVAVAIGYGIYRGGVRINLSRFFRFTGLVLVLVAGGLVANALHTAHEAGWLDFGQGRTLDLSWLVRPGSVRSSLLTGMLGVQAHPVTIEVVGWALYVLPATCYVAAPPGRGLPRRSKQILTSIGATAGAGATVLLTTLPAAPQLNPTTAGDGWSAQVTAARPDGARTIRTQARNPAAGGNPGSGLTETTLMPTGTQTRDGLTVAHYAAELPGTDSTSRPAELAPVDVAALNGGRLPLGTAVQDGAQTLPVRYQDVVRVEAWLQPDTDRVVDLVWTELVTASLVRPDGSAVPLAQPVASGAARLPDDTARAAQRAASADLRTDRTRSLRKQAAGSLAALAAATLAAAALLHAFPRPRPTTDGHARPADVAALR